MVLSKVKINLTEDHKVLEFVYKIFSHRYLYLSGVCTCLDLIQYSNSNVLKVLRFWLYYEKRAAPFNFFMFKDFLYGTMSLSTNSFIHSSSGSR